MSDFVNLAEIYDDVRGNGLYQISEQVGVWEFRMEALQDFKLRIKVTRGPEGMYLANTDYLPKAGGVYPQLQTTAQDALRDTLTKFHEVSNVQNISKDDFELVERF